MFKPQTFFLLGVAAASAAYFAYQYLYGPAQFSLKILGHSECSLVQIELVSETHTIKLNQEHLSSYQIGSYEWVNYSIPALASRECEARAKFSNCEELVSDSEFIKLRSAYYLYLKPNSIIWHRRA